MKRFEAPIMNIQKLANEEIIRTSVGCMVESLACLDCYCTSVQCSGTYVCEGLRCPILSSFEEF